MDTLHRVKRTCPINMSVKESHAKCNNIVGFCQLLAAPLFFESEQ